MYSMHYTDEAGDPERFDVTNVRGAWDVAKIDGHPLRIFLTRHEEDKYTFYRDNKIVAKLTLRTAVEEKRNDAKEQLDAKVRQETERSWNAAKEEQDAKFREKQRLFNETVRARNAAKEQERAEFRERQRKLAALSEKHIEEQKAREQPRPAPSGESAEKRQRFMEAKNLVLTRKRMAQELEDLKSEIRRVNLLSYAEAKTFQKEQTLIWHPDKRFAGMDHTQEEHDHAVHMLHVVRGKTMQTMAMDK